MLMIFVLYQTEILNVYQLAFIATSFKEIHTLSDTLYSSRKPELLLTETV